MARVVLEEPRQTATAVVLPAMTLVPAPLVDIAGRARRRGQAHWRQAWRHVADSERGEAVALHDGLAVEEGARVAEQIGAPSVEEGHALEYVLAKVHGDVPPQARRCAQQAVLAIEPRGPRRAAAMHEHLLDSAEHLLMHLDALEVRDELLDAGDVFLHLVLLALIEQLHAQLVRDDAQEEGVARRAEEHREDRVEALHGRHHNDVAVADARESHRGPVEGCDVHVEAGVPIVVHEVKPVGLVVVHADAADAHQAAGQEMQQDQHHDDADVDAHLDDELPERVVHDAHLELAAHAQRRADGREDAVQPQQP
mmetsp:Transcript_41184/g.129068  ORF Transcript_41184/g.129068 Transcript_41184/m.129068 type:complete len:311 (-) Transcript_41184:782-1714(-)